MVGPIPTVGLERKVEKRRQKATDRCFRALCFIVFTAVLFCFQNILDDRLELYDEYDLVADSPVI